MKILVVDKDQLGTLLCEKNVKHAIKAYNRDNQSFVIMLGSMAVEISIEEINNLNDLWITGKAI